MRPLFFLRPHLPWANWIAVAMIAVWGIVLTGYAFIRHGRLNSSVYDFGIKSQVIWNTFQGEWFASTIEVEHYLGDHVQLIFVLLAPLFALWRDPRVLLLVQSLLLCTAGWPLFRIARRRLKHDGLALLVTAAYLLYPTVGFVNRFDFHALTFVIFFFLMAIDFLEQERLGWASVMLVLALATREEVGFTVFALGIYLALVRGRPWFGSVWAVLGVSWSAVALFVIIPAFRGGSSDSLGRYAWLGSDPVAMIGTILTRPQLVIDHLTEPERLWFLVMILLPVGFLALLSPRILAVGIPALTYNLLSDVPSQSSIYFQYTAPLIPFVFLALIEGIEQLRVSGRRLGRRPVPWIAGWLIVAIIVSWALENPFTTPIQSPYFEVYGLGRFSDRAAFDEALALLPADASVSTMMAYGPHLSLRRRYNLFYSRARLESRPLGVPQTDFFLLHLTDLRWGVNARIFYALIETAIGRSGYEAIYADADVVLLTRTDDPQPATGAVLQRVIDLQEAGGKYAPTGRETLAWLGRQWVSETVPQGAVSPNEPIIFGEWIELAGIDIGGERFGAGEPFCPTVYWQAIEPLDRPYTVFVHLVAADGFVQAQRDSEPAFGFWPTTRWQLGEIVGDMHCMALPPGLAAGEYAVVVGVYDGATGERLPLNGTAQTDHRATTIEIK